MTPAVIPDAAYDAIADVLLREAERERDELEHEVPADDKAAS